ncbi:MAG: SDR family oxidoreductase [Alphaproteobacteria bacterium]|nr:SDR family oxidoreductase [Alphaproteobacteria bacterium]
MITDGSHRDRVVVVTGGGSGIGLGLVKAFAEAGSSVAVLDANTAAAHAAADAMTAAGHRAIAVGCDVADWSAVQAAATVVERAFGSAAILINNAGISPKHDGKGAATLEMDPDEWNRVIAVNLTGVFHGVRAFGPAMATRGWGSIVNQSSVAAKNFIPVVGAHYPATKAALMGLTTHWAGELGPNGINVNALAPGRIDTPLAQGVPPEVNAAIVKATPLGRIGSPADVAAAALFLTSDAGHFVTGQTLDVAGGWMM